MEKNGMYLTGILAGSILSHVLFDHVKKERTLERQLQVEETDQGCNELEIQNLESEFDVGVYCQDDQYPVIMVYEE